MKKIFYLLLIGVFMCPHQSKAEPYYVARSFDNNIKAFLHQVRLHQDHSVLTLQLMSLLYQKM